MFFRIYLGIILSILSCIGASYLIYDEVNEHRLLRYNSQIYSGTLALVTQGVSRYQEPRRSEWLSIARNLSGLDLKLSGLSVLNVDQSEQGALDAGGVVFRHSEQEGQYQAVAPINGEEAPFLVAELDRVTERQLRVPALLLINELNRVPNNQRTSALNELRSVFSFPVKISSLSDIDLDRNQDKRLKKGDIVVSLAFSPEGQETLKVYALLEQGGQDVLVLGSIPVFDPVPMWLAASFLLLTLLVMGMAAYFMVRRVQLRIKRLASAMHRFGAGSLESRADIKGDDTFTDLAEQFNGMAEKISDLILEQKHLTQAVSHELRTPITRMKFRLDMLSQNLGAANEAEQERIDGVKRDLQELNRLVDETLIFQTLETNSEGQTAAGQVRESINILELVNEIRDELQAHVGEAKVELQAESTDVVVAYRHHLKRAMMNLVSNALRYCESRVLIRFESMPDGYLLMVEDDGGGIPKEYWESIFQPFHRVDKSRSKGSGGYGLGLAIVQRIANLHGGEVKIVAGSLGGACFEFVWPKKL